MSQAKSQRKENLSRLRYDLRYFWPEFKQKSIALLETQGLYFLGFSRFVVLISVLVAYILTTYLLFFDIRFYDHRSYVAIVLHIGDAIYAIDLLWKVVFEEVHLFRYQFQPDGCCEDPFHKCFKVFTAIVHICSTLPVEYVACFWKDEHSEKWLRTFAILRLFRLYRLRYVYFWHLREKERACISMPGRIWKIAFVPLIGVAILIYHALACYWYWYSCEPVIKEAPPVCGKWMQQYYDHKNEFSQKGHHPFFRHVNLKKPDPFLRYIGCLLWSLMTIRNSGNFYFPPTDQEQMIFSLFLMSFTFISQFAVILIAINLTLAMDMPRLLFYTEMKGVQNFLRYLNFHRTILPDVLQCFDSVWNKRRVFTDKGIRRFFTPNLEQTICMEKASPLFFASELLHTFTRAALEALATAVEFKTYFAGEFIIAPGTTDYHMRLLANGYAQIIDPEDENKRIMTLTTGSLIGEANLICPTLRTVGIQAVTDCEIMMLSFHSVNSILKIDSAMRRQMHIIILRRLDFISPRLTPEQEHDQRVELSKKKNSLERTFSKITFMTVDIADQSTFSIINEDSPKDDLARARLVRFVSLFTYRHHLKQSRFDRHEYNQYDKDVYEQMQTRYRNRASNASYRLAKEAWAPPYIFGLWSGIAIAKDTFFYQLWSTLTFVYIVIHSVWLMKTIFLFESGNTVMAINMLTDLVYGLDAVLLLFIFRDPGEVVSKAEAINYTYHMLIEIRNPRAWFDIIAVFPIWCFSPVKNPYPQWMRFNVLFKFFCIFFKARELEQEITFSTLGTRVVKHATNFLGFVVIMSFFATLLRCGAVGYSNCVMEPNPAISTIYNLNDPGESIIGVFMYRAICVVFGIGFRDLKFRTHESEMYIAAYLLGFGLLVYCWAELISTYIEMSEMKLKYEKARVWMGRYLTSCFADRALIKSVDRFLTNQWDCWRGIESVVNIGDKGGLITIGHTVYDELIVQAVAETIYSVSLFKWMEPTMVRAFSLASQLLFVGPRRVIIPYGDYVGRLYIIRRGIVEVTIVSGVSCPVLKKLGPGNILGFGEMAFKMTSMVHVRSVSGVELIAIDAQSFSRIFETSKLCRRAWLNFLNTPKNRKLYQSILAPNGCTPLVRYRDKWAEEKKPIVPAINFFKPATFAQKRLKIGNPKWKQPWKRAPWWIRILKPVSLKMTIHPLKITEQIWETFRFLVIYGVLFIVPVGEAFPCFKKTMLPFYCFSDVVSVIDMFVRCYTAYYGPRYNFHPAKTIRHYLTGAFITDIIGGPIFYYFVSWLLDNYASIEFQEGMIAYFLRINRIIMIYHVFRYHGLYKQDLWEPSYIRRLLKVLPILLFHIHLLSCIFSVKGCPQLNCPYPQPRCRSKTWITNALLHRGHPIWGGNGLKPTDLEIYSSAFYYTSATSAGCAFGDFAAVNSDERVFMAITLFVYIIAIAFIMARVIAFQSLKHFNLKTFQMQINHLLDFMVHEFVDYHLKTSILGYYEHQWHQCKADNPREHFLTLYPALREEVGMYIYKNAFEMIVELQSSSEGFLRGVCDIIQFQYIPMGQVIFRENDVCDTFYIIKSGMILCSKEAYVGTRIKDYGILGSNGCFYEYTASAVDHLQLLVFSKKDFEPLISVFPKEVANLKAALRKDHKEPYDRDGKGKKTTTTGKSVALKRTMSDITHLSRKSDWNLDNSSDHNLHLIGNEAKMDPAFEEPLSMVAQPLSDFDQDIDDSKFDYKTLYRGFVLHHNSSLSVFLSTLYFIGAFGSVTFVAYQASFKNFEGYAFGVTYALDLIYVTKMIVSFFVTSLNADGTIISDRTDIGVKYFGHFNGFTYDLITIFPFEVLAPVQYEWIDWKHMITLLRLNRLLRIKHVWEFFNPNDYNSGYNVFISRLKIARIIVLTLVYLHLMACYLQFWTLWDCPNKQEPNFPQCMEDFKNITWLGTKTDGDFIKHPYTYAMYFVFQTFTATAYGDVRPMSEFEMVFVSVLAISSKAWLAMSLADFVSGIHLHMDPQAMFSLAVSESLADYKYDGISDFTIQRVAKHLEAVWVFSRGVILPDYVENLPLGLKKDLFFFLYEKHIMKSYLFYNLPDNFCRELSIRFQRMIVLQGEYIIKSGEIGDRMYIIHSGTVTFRKTYPDKEGKYNKKEGRVSCPRHFGEENAVLGRRRYHCSYIAETDVELLFLDHEILQQLFFPCFKDVRKIVMTRFEKVYKTRRGQGEKQQKPAEGYKVSVVNETSKSGTKLE